MADPSVKKLTYPQKINVRACKESDFPDKNEYRAQKMLFYDSFFICPSNEDELFLKGNVFKNNDDWNAVIFTIMPC